MHHLLLNLVLILNLTITVAACKADADPTINFKPSAKGKVERSPASDPVIKKIDPPNLEAEEPTKKEEGEAEMTPEEFEKLTEEEKQAFLAKEMHKLLTTYLPLGKYDGKTEDNEDCSIQVGDLSDSGQEIEIKVHQDGNEFLFTVSPKLHFMIFHVAETPKRLSIEIANPTAFTPMQLVNPNGGAPSFHITVLSLSLESGEAKAIYIYKESNEAQELPASTKCKIGLRVN